MILKNHRRSLHALFLIAGALFSLIGTTLNLAGFNNGSLDIIQHDTYFVISHLHVWYLCSLLLFGFAGCYWLFQKITGHPMCRIPGLIHFWITAPGLLICFMPQRNHGVAGMPRRYYDYTAWASFKQFISLNHFISAVAVLIFFAQLVFIGNLAASTYRQLRRGNSVD